MKFTNQSQYLKIIKLFNKLPNSDEYLKNVELIALCQDCKNPHERNTNELKIVLEDFHVKFIHARFCSF
jgi:hypothetical protein